MFLDAQLVFSDAQAITATAVSTNSIDTTFARNIGTGPERLYVVFLVKTAFTDSGSDSTVTPSLQTDSDPAFGTVATIRTYDTFAALSPVGTRLIYLLEPITPAGKYKQYIRMNYTLANGSLTTGAISAFIVDTAQLDAIYPSGYSIK